MEKNKSIENTSEDIFEELLEELMLKEWIEREQKRQSWEALDLIRPY